MCTVVILNRYFSKLCIAKYNNFVRTSNVVQMFISSCEIQHSR